ncbi:Phosphomannomutase [Nowakowskiella sp. JEL0407]|nr:Phosphomannomutase [Nowakowskiella sp. JEL0407]
MKETLIALRKVCVVGFVGGSDLSKQLEQIGEDALDLFDFAFAENGLTAYRLGKELKSQSFINHIGEEQYKKIVNFVLKYVAKLSIPQKRGTFVEFRRGMINISPIGRNCSHPERDAFEVYDKEHQIRSTFVTALRKEFAHCDLTYSIGGQISFDVFPTGWDKTYCLQHLEGEGFDTIHFFGDKYMKGGNDFEIYSHPATIGHPVSSPNDTMKILNSLFDLSPKAEKPASDGLLSGVISKIEGLETRFSKLEVKVDAISKNLEKLLAREAEKEALEKLRKGDIVFKITN